MPRNPNFIYIGPDKAGSSWLHDVLIEHPQVFMTPAKDLYFFDRYYDKGLDWYAAHFEKATDEKVCRRGLPGLPVPPRGGRAYRSSLGSHRPTIHGHAARPGRPGVLVLSVHAQDRGQHPGTFAEALRSRPELLNHGQLRRLLSPGSPTAVADDSIYVAVFDDLGADAEAFVGDLLDMARHLRR